MITGVLSIAGGVQLQKQQIVLIGVGIAIGVLLALLLALSAATVGVRDGKRAVVCGVGLGFWGEGKEVEGFARVSMVEVEEEVVKGERVRAFVQ